MFMSHYATEVCKCPELLPHSLKKITARNTQIYMLDTQIISIFTLARWHQFGLTEQVAFLHLPDNQQFTIFLVAR